MLILSRVEGRSGIKYSVGGVPDRLALDTILHCTGPIYIYILVRCKASWGEPEQFYKQLYVAIDLYNIYVC